MPFNIAHRKESDVPQPTKSGRVNADLQQMKAELARLRNGMVLEIDSGSRGAVRRTKGLVTRAGNQLGARFEHWHEGSKVFARPAAAVRRRRRPKHTGV